MYFANVGRVSATGFEAVATMTKESLPSYKTLRSPQTKRVASTQFRPHTQMPPDIPGFRTDDVHIAFDTDMFTNQDIARMNTADETVEIKGSLKYEDGFGNRIFNEYCFMYLVVQRHVFAQSGASTGGGEGGWGLCSNMRRTVAEVKAWRNR